MVGVFATEIGLDPKTVAIAEFAFASSLPLRHGEWYAPTPVRRGSPTSWIIR